MGLACILLLIKEELFRSKVDGLALSHTDFPIGFTLSASLDQSLNTSTQTGSGDLNICDGYCVKKCASSAEQIQCSLHPL